MNKRFFIQFNDGYPHNGLILKIDAKDQEMCSRGVRHVYGDFPFKFLPFKEGIKHKPRYLKFG